MTPIACSLVNHTTMNTPPSNPTRYPTLARLLHTVRLRSGGIDAAARSLIPLKNELVRLQRMIDTDAAVDNARVRSLMDSIRSIYELLDTGLLGPTFTRQLQEEVQAAQTELDTAFSPPQSRLQRMFNFVQENPGRSLAGAALLAVGAPVVAPALLVGGLNVIGFSSIGPVAGSLAATIQSVAYGGAVASGSLFAAAQSAAMGGVAVASAAEVVLGAAAMGTGLGMVATAGDQQGEQRVTIATTDATAGDQQGEQRVTIATTDATMSPAGSPPRDDSRAVCLIDGDTFTFCQDFLVDGREGGRRAALRLRATIMEHLRSQSNAQLHQIAPRQVEVHIFCDVNGLANDLTMRGACTTQVFEQFIVGFNEAAPSFTIVDEGSAATRVREELLIFSRNPHIKSIIFGGVYDAQHLITLQSLQGGDTLNKVIILRGPYGISFFFEAYHEQSGLHTMEISGLFTRRESLSTVASRAVSTITRLGDGDAPAGLPQEPFTSLVSVDNGQNNRPLIGQARRPRTIVPTPETGDPPSAAPPDISTHSSQELVPAGPVWDDDLRGEFAPAGATTQIDPHKPLTRQTPPLCNAYYLQPKRCPRKARCKYSHQYILTIQQLETYRSEVKRLPCKIAPANGVCPNGDSCLMGHVCPHGRKCRYLLSKTCKFRTHNASPAELAGTSAPSGRLHIP